MATALAVALESVKCEIRLLSADGFDLQAGLAEEIRKVLPGLSGLARQQYRPHFDQRCR